MQMHQFTSLCDPSLQDLAAALDPLKPQAILLAQFNQSFRHLKAEPALRCILHAFANEIDPNNIEHAQGIAILPGPNEFDSFPPGYRFPVCLSVMGMPWPANQQYLRDAAKRVERRLRGSADSSAFRSLQTSVIDASAFLALVDHHVELGCIEMPELLKQLMHLQLDGAFPKPGIDPWDFVGQLPGESDRQVPNRDAYVDSVGDVP